MARKNIGRVSVPRDYETGATYYLYNVVSLYGSVYMCTVESTTTPPATLGDDGKPVIGEGWRFFADCTDVYDAVRVTEQALTDSQKEQARENIGAPSYAAAAGNRADIDRLAARQNAPDDRALPLLCGQPPILFGAGTPKETVVPDNWNQYDPATGEGYNWNGKPSAVGQQYIDTTAQSGGRYVAARNGEWDLKWINS